MASGIITENDLKAILEGVLPLPGDPGYCYCNAVTATTISSSDTNVKLPINSIADNIGDYFEYDSTNKGIKCVKPGAFLFSIQVRYNTATSGDLIGVGVMVNNIVRTGPIYTRAGGTYETVTMPMMHLQLNQNDVVTLFIRNNTSGRGAADSVRFELYSIGRRIPSVIDPPSAAIKCAKWTGAAGSTNLTDSRVWHGMSAFSGYTISHTIPEGSCFSTDTNGLKVLEDGYYLSIAFAHFNLSASSKPVALTITNYTKSDTNISNTYYAWTPGSYVSCVVFGLSYCEANDVIIPKYQKYADDTSTGYRPSAATLVMVKLM